MTIIRTPMRLSWPRCYIFFLFIVSWVREINAIEHNSEASFSIYDEESQLQNRETSDLCETTECSQRNAAQPAIDIFENVAQLLYEPDRAFLPHINYALIPHSSLSWTQTSGSSLTLVNTYLVSSENHADTIEKMDDDQFTRRLRQMLPYLQNPQNAQLVDRGRAITLSQANVSYSFGPHTPPRDETELYSFERILKLHNSYDHFVTLEANISVESTFPQCFGPHLVKIVLDAKYEFRSQPHEPHEALESQEAGTAQWATTYGEHDTLHWMKGAEERTMIYFDATLTEEVQSVQRLVRETTSFYGPIEQVIIRIIITTKCPQAIQINQLLLLMYMPMEIAFEAGEKTKYLLPSSVVSNDSLHPDESTDDERAEPVGMVKVLADGAYIERLVVEPKSTGTFSFVSFYVSPSRIHGSHDWNIWYGTRVHISHSNSVKITLKCPTKVTQLHLQAPTLEELIIHGYDIMTGVFVNDEKEPDTHACDEVLVELTFPRHKSTLTVEDLFFICDGNPCSIRPFLPDDSRNPIPRSPGLSRDSLNPAATSFFRRRGSLLKEARLAPTPILLQQHNIIHATSAKRVSYTTIGIFTLGLLLCCIALIALHRRRRRFLSSARFVALAPKEENELARTDVDIQMIDESVLHS